MALSCYVGRDPYTVPTRASTASVRVQVRHGTTGPSAVRTSAASDRWSSRVADPRSQPLRLQMDPRGRQPDKLMEHPGLLLSYSLGDRFGLAHRRGDIGRQRRQPRLNSRRTSLGAASLLARRQNQLRVPSDFESSVQLTRASSAESRTQAAMGVDRWLEALTPTNPVRGAVRSRHELGFGRERGSLDLHLHITDDEGNSPELERASYGPAVALGQARFAGRLRLTAGYGALQLL